MYHLERAVHGKETVFIDWLYVAEDFRLSDVANSLMAQMFLKLADTKPANRAIRRECLIRIRT